MKTALSEALKESITNLRKIHVKKDLSEGFCFTELSQSIPYDTVEAIAELVKEDVQLKELTSKFQVGPDGNDPVHVSEERLARFIISKAYYLNDPDEAIKELKYLVSTNRSYYRFITMLTGLTPTDKIEVAKNLYLSPIDEIDLIFNPGLQNIRNQIYGGPSAALIEIVPYSPVFVFRHEIDRKGSVWRLREAYTISNVIALAAGASVGVVCGCFEGNYSLPAGNQSTYLSQALMASNIKTTISANLDPDSLRSTVRSYQNFQGDRGPLDISIGRLNRARSHVTQEDAALDLGIATEILMRFNPTQKNRPRKKGPITDLIISRASYLLGDDESEKQYYSGWFNVIYSLRSFAVHEGHLPKTIAAPNRPGAGMNGSLEMHIALIVAGVIVGDLIQKVMNLKHWPEWEKFVIPNRGSNLGPNVKFLGDSIYTP